MVSSSCFPPNHRVPVCLHSLDGISWRVASSRQTQTQCWYNAALLRQSGVAVGLIETSPRPISTDGCHMYANREQSESRSAISTTCLPHTAATPQTHKHTLMHTLPSPSNPFRGTRPLPPVYSCVLIRVKTFIIILFFFRS